jgi:hypothetical protein
VTLINIHSADRVRSSKEKLAEVETKIADSQVIASTLRAAVAAGCDDLVVCHQRSTCGRSSARRSR